MAGVGGTSNVRYAIYSGDDDEPTNLLWQSNSLPLTPADANAWFTIATGGVEFTSNSSIWLCENSDAENTATGNFVTVNTQGLIAEKSFPFGSFPQTPDNWRLPNPNVQYAMYVNYIPTNLPQITILNPAEVWLSKGLLNVGVRFDLLAEVFKDSTLVSSGQLNSVQVGSGGFNNADLVSVPFNSFSPVDFPQGSELKIKVSVRNACTGSLPNQGTARLWFNDNQANSHFGATIGTTNNSYYLLDNFLLSTTVGAGPRQNIDVQAGAKCSPFKSFGTWTITP
jgi:hypothetical protein